MLARIAFLEVVESLATHFLEDGDDIRTVPELLGYTDVSTIMTYMDA